MPPRPLTEAEVQARLRPRSGLVQVEPRTLRDQADDAFAMDFAIRAAVSAHRERGDLPFGCTIVNGEGRTLALSSGTGTELDPTAHSEMSAIRQAYAAHGGPLLGCTLYSTHEPCAMCCGAISHAHISRVVWGSYRKDLPHLFADKIPAALLLANTTRPPAVHGGVKRQACIALFDGVERWSWA